MTAVTRDSQVTLREVTKETVRDVCKLKVADSQNKFVAPNAVSIAEAYFYDTAWFRAIYADETPVGFIMIEQIIEKPEYYLWRMMVADGFQKMSFGNKAMFILIDYVKTLPNATELLTSCVPGEGSPEGFYKKLGFARNGKTFNGEVELSLAIN